MEFLDGALNCVIETIGQQQCIATDSNFFKIENGITDNRVNPIIIFFAQKEFGKLWTILR